ncbi:thiamine-phosphate kinase [Asaia krungthepensis]|uniref:Thiamine-monophosphate kinase n=1 Tax=Asaia krungthepensis NRIC 0535 TaxID=1307925 RepID=A0ABQ0PXQ7_9PROT|nr:thiamine-phosphate kinase [Asaia krungthepensis]GBQ84162.1 thiamine monophosphate kinase [Asaia krungthepensis NRIC 0535]
MSGGEFDFIDRFFAPLAGEGALGLGDDAALIGLAPDRELVLSTDTLVEAVHFLPDDPAETISRKLLRVSLSDCAAMGARPRGYLLNISRPAAFDDQWFASFSTGLALDQKLYDVVLLGGDTTSTRGPLVLSLTILGEVERGRAVRRSGAQLGDTLWVTGTVGDAALGLQALLGELPDEDGYLADRYRLPRPRTAFPLAGLAHAGMDISDGLVQDAGHLARQSAVRLEIDAASIPLSPQAAKTGEAWFETCLTGGDDYELLFTAPEEHSTAIMSASREAGIAVTRIGRVTAGQGVVVLDAKGQEMRLSRTGWQHF